MVESSITVDELKRRLAVAEGRALAAEAEMRESSIRHRLLIESWAQAVWETDADGVVVTDSPSWRKYTGQRVEEWLGSGWLDAIHPGDRAYAERQWREAMAARRVLDAEFRLRAPNGGWRWTNVRAAPVLNTEGRIEKWTGVNLDIDDRKRAEAALQESEAKFRTVFETIDHAFVVQEIIRDQSGLAVDMRYVEINPAFTRQTGLGPEIVGKFVSEVMPDVERFFIEIHDRVARTGTPERFENYNQSTGRWYDAHITAVGEQGRFAASVFEDVTARKLAEIALRESEERQAFLLKLSDALRPLKASGEIKSAAMQVLGQHLGVIRANYFETDTGGEYWETEGGYVHGVPPVTGRIRGDDFGTFWKRNFAEGRDVIMSNIATHPRLSRAEIAAFEGLDFRASVGLPLLKEGAVVAVLGLHHSEAHEWSELELDLARETAERTWAAVERARAEAALRENEERQAFLLRLSDAMRAEVEPQALGSLATRMVGEHMGVDRCWISRISHEEGLSRLGPEYRRIGLAPVSGDYALANFPESVRQSETAYSLVSSDVAEDRALSELDRAGYMAMGVAAHVAAILRRGERTSVWGLSVGLSAPHAWTNAEVALVEEAAERIWAATERAHADAALRNSEERFQQFARASSDGLWIRNADTLTLEYCSPAMEAIYGAPCAELMADPLLWTALVVPDDRNEVLSYIDRMRAGEPVEHEFRIQRRSDGEFRWIRSVGFPLHHNGEGITRIAGISSDVTEAKLATEHQAVLLAELQHRVRNIMAVFRSIIARTSDGASSVTEYAELLAGRLNTFARVQALLTRAANVGVGMATIVDDELYAIAVNERQFDAKGPDVELSPKAAETMTLAVHELSTNALKYGALSSPDGCVRVRWDVVEKGGRQWLSFDWSETGAPDRAPSSGPRRVGFGSELIEGRIPYELGGRGTVSIEVGGARCHLEFPLAEGASILETDSPQRATVFGGAIDMSGQADLAGQRILVVEDDYYLATDTARALRGAGAEVLGPCATEDAARDQMNSARPTGAILDINLRGGRSFELAEELKRTGIPFVFVTGYDQDVIPEIFDEVTRIQKPVEFRQIVGALATALS